MLLIKEYDSENNYRTLVHGPEVFKCACKYVLRGENRFHVKGPMGSYDLLYQENQAWAESSADYPDSPFLHKMVIHPPYLIYDESWDEMICLDVFKGIRTAVFEQADEYSLTVIRVLLRLTDIDVICRDERFRWFLEENGQLKMTGAPVDLDDPSVLHVQADYYPSTISGDFHTVDPVTLFHNVFVYQWLSDKPISQIKYVELIVAKSEGIGSVMTIYSRAKYFFRNFDCKVTLCPGTSRYSDKLMKKFFNVELTPDDADAGNTLTIYNYFALLFTRMMRQASVGDFDYNSLNPDFLNDMKEYADAVIGDKKILGLLVRGSDYITSKMSGVSAPVSTDVIIPKVKEWMKTDGFDGIFLATEDADVLETMEKAFPGILRAVSQERYRVSDFEKYQGITTISELDRERHKDDFDEFVEDTTSNYFYALYILSRCESVMYSGQCGGASMVRSMNGDRFRRIYLFAQDEELK